MSFLMKMCCQLKFNLLEKYTLMGLHIVVELVLVWFSSLHKKRFYHCLLLWSNIAPIVSERCRHWYLDLHWTSIWSNYTYKSLVTLTWWSINIGEVMKLRSLNCALIVIMVKSLGWLRDVTLQHVCRIENKKIDVLVALVSTLTLSN